MFAPLLITAFVASGALVNAQQDCGRPEVVQTDADRIVGGSYATHGAWPWQVALRKGGQHMCGGSIIDSTHILTAAHCFNRDGTSPTGWTVHAGSYYRDMQDSTEQIVQVSRITRHSGYNQFFGFNYDMAIMTVSTALTFNKNVKKVCLANSGATLAAGTSCTVTGWGETKDPSYDGRLKQATVPIVSSNTCYFSYPGAITSNMVCAGENSSTNRPCFGDSGGPLVCQAASGEWVQYGTVSFGDQFCSDPNKYGVYASVASLRSFIDQNVG